MNAPEHGNAPIPGTGFDPDGKDRLRLRIRRVVFFSTVFLVSAAGTLLMADFLARTGWSALDGVLLGLFCLLFGYIVFGSCQALAGFWLSLRGGDPYSIDRTVVGEEEKIPLAATAVVMPVFNEDARRIVDGMRVLYRSIEKTEALEFFDFFILSDSTDSNHWIEEEHEWLHLCRELKGIGRVFYRKRTLNINQKSGNISDFCRRWGRHYRYMVVLDADSVMTGATVLGLVRLMEKNPSVGIVQTPPRLFGAQTLFGRLQQFANGFYGPYFDLGINFWQQGEGNFWGHNAIIRLEPFINYCALPDLPGHAPLGGRILSHDFVEAALMRKAGWKVWLACDRHGSYEEGPQSIVEHAKRDRRWCQGNLQHSWLVFSRGLHPISRLHFVLGICAYASSFLWLCFLVLGTLLVLHQARTGLTLIPRSSFLGVGGFDIFSHGLMIFGLTMVILLLPKICALAECLLRKRKRRTLGGGFRVTAGVALEILASILLAPVLMLFHSKFVIYTLLGRGVSWVAPQRGLEEKTDWRQCILTHGPHTLYGVAAACFFFVFFPPLGLWMTPVLTGLILSIPLALLLNSRASGHAVGRRGILRTSVETSPPEELQWLARWSAETGRKITAPRELVADYGLLRVVLDPHVNAVHRSFLREKKGDASGGTERFGEACERLLSRGPDSLTSQERQGLLYDAASVARLHEEVWRRPDRNLDGWWQLAIHHYRIAATYRR